MRHWYHQHDGVRQAVEVLGWTQHGAVVLGLEDGWLPQTEPVFVRMDELVMECGVQWGQLGWRATCHLDANHQTPHDFDTNEMMVEV